MRNKKKNLEQNACEDLNERKKVKFLWEFNSFFHVKRGLLSLKKKRRKFS